MDHMKQEIQHSEAKENCQMMEMMDPTYCYTKGQKILLENPMLKTALEAQMHSCHTPLSNDIDRVKPVYGQ